MSRDSHKELTPKLVDSLYVEAMNLADEARDYFERSGQEDRADLDPVTRVAFSCESLKVTTRLMHVISWLLVRKAIHAGEISEEESRRPDRKLGEASDTDMSDTTRLDRLPERARSMIARSKDLYQRVRRIEEQLWSETQDSPARALQGRLERLL